MEITQNIINAFGGDSPPVLLHGGQGQSYRAGNIVLKPVDDLIEAEWIAEFYATTKCRGFLLPVPIRASNGRFVYKSWQAWQFFDSKHNNNWQDMVDYCINFHKEIAHVEKPSYFANRQQNPWVIADNILTRLHLLNNSKLVTELKFGFEKTQTYINYDQRELLNCDRKELLGVRSVKENLSTPYKFQPEIAEQAARLYNVMKPVDTKPQLIHGDFGGNMLFSPNTLPMVIDFSPYWQAPELAVGVVVADAIVWENADYSLIDYAMKVANFEQFLLRAELRRIIELDTVYKIHNRNILNQITAHIPLIDEIIERCG